LGWVCLEEANPLWKKGIANFDHGERYTNQKTENLAV